MATEFSGGLVVFRRIDNSLEYLLLQSSKGEHHWTPPKGHLNKGETFLEAAIRETEEEAGLVEHKDYTIVDRDFKIEIDYPVKNRLKQVVYWLAELNDADTKVTISDEHISLAWAVLQEAIDLVRHETNRADRRAKYESNASVLNRAEEYLKAKF